MRVAFASFAALLAAGCGDKAGTGGPIASSDLVRACAVEVSCLKAPPLAPGGACVTQLQSTLASGLGGWFYSADQVRRFVACTKSAADCTGALDCISQHHGPDYCMAHPGDSCDGTLAVHCAPVDGWALRWDDCAALGLRCAIGANGAAVCTDGTACDPAKEPNTCQGDALITCDPGARLRERIDCATVLTGARCAAWIDDAGKAEVSCVPPGADCKPGMPDNCDGNAVITCIAAHEVRIDCGALGATCQAMTGAAQCMTVATDCTNGVADRCNGAALEMCVDGRWSDVACGTLGAGACQATMIGAGCGPP